MTCGDVSAMICKKSDSMQEKIHARVALVRITGTFLLSDLIVSITLQRCVALIVLGTLSKPIFVVTECLLDVVRYRGRGIDLHGSMLIQQRDRSIIAKFG